MVDLENEVAGASPKLGGTAEQFVPIVVMGAFLYVASCGILRLFCG